MKSKPLEIGVTGGIGSGKSLVCKIFSLLGVPVYNADNRAKWLTNNNPEVRRKITEKFGEAAYTEKGLDRDYIAGKVFNDPDQLKILNAIVHPAVGEDYDRWVTSNGEKPYVIKEAALIFEAGSYKRLHKVINVSAPEELRIKRVIHRDPFRNEKEIKSIIEKQMPEAERQQRADFNVFNDENQMLIPQILKLHEEILSLA
ncbi:dephospho-CoA kinase [Fulvivirga kasyanovii]|uniref:Dephospho-CoA kinase n=1 Tax=Fulvivirga kasyanovii TaxID=396812 RepID=A0ABW9RLI5_9BACT|nr:dephospho-CoA kinase [Fulvivirga kasyanovii]MTI24805.1 dephospho-CoA kinase [Fulvivirga kasyanovii]